MHDPRHLLDPATEAVRRLARRGYNLDPERLGSLVASRSQSIQATDAARAESKQLAASVNTAARAGEPTEELAEKGRTLKTKIQELETELERHEAALHDMLLEIPNLPKTAAQTETATNSPSKSAEKAHRQHSTSNPSTTSTSANDSASSTSPPPPNSPGHGSPSSKAQAPP